MSALKPGFESDHPVIARDIQEAPALRLADQLLFGEQRARDFLVAQGAEVRKQVVGAVQLLQQRADRLRFNEDGIDAAGLARLQNFLTSTL